MVSIALVSFLVGTLFSMVSTALDIMPNPFGNLLDSSEPHVKVVRLNDPKEINVTSGFYNPSIFVWTPCNPQDNAILEFYPFLEYRLEKSEQGGYPLGWFLSLNFIINGDFSCYGHIHFSAGSQEQWEQGNFTSWQWFSFSVDRTSEKLWISPNQRNYTIALSWGSEWTGFLKIYVRNINVILTVVDGL